MQEITILLVTVICADFKALVEDLVKALDRNNTCAIRLRGETR